MSEKRTPTMDKRTIRILLVDDHPVLRRGVRDTLAAEMDIEVSGEAGDAATALKLLETSRPDVAVVDISLERDSGLELMRTIRTHYPDVKILALSMHDDSLYAERVIRVGALGYVNKSQPGDVLIRALRKVAEGEMVLSPDLTDQIVKRVVSVDGPPRTGIAALSDRELQIFEFIGRGLVVREIAEQLCISIKTVESHVEHIKTKLGMKSSRELVRRAALWIEGDKA